ncbi:MAG: restriction endonuclease subunit S [Nostoc sp. NOS(2021)]|uniref:restriction endonuclease subunit S n=1 Tax=Nostoc sp. NOS(2021) TaxID=2815407 RepID=UPI0025D88530|nr:restriction endonuclease subunit S [Nostoc sp. NOS(2021)]MBN3893993.1 restriction endonuclease subunit S [Nostoc sp. NOS(2021)]
MFQTLPKDGGLSSLGTIPDDWEIVTFKDVCEVRQGLQIAISKRYKNYKNGRFVYITIEYLNNLNNQNLLEYIDSPGARVICKHNDVLVARTGATGKIITGVEGVFHNNFFLVDYNRKEVDINYLVHYLKFEPVQKEIKFRAGTTTIPDLNHGDFYSLTFIKPKIPEQQKIAEILDAIDKAIALTDTHITKLKKAKAGLLHDLLTRGIDDHGELRDYTRNPELFKRSALGIIPKDWDVSSVTFEFDIISGFTLGEHRRPLNKKRKYLRVANVKRENIILDDIAEIEANDDEFVARQLEENDLLIVEGHADPNEIGRCAIVSDEAVGLTFQNHLFRLRSKVINPKFALFWLNSAWVRSYWKCLCGTSSGLNTINQTMLNALLVLVPNKKEQIDIVERIETYKERIIKKETYLKKLKLLKKGLMSDLLTGRVRVKI